MADLKVLIVEDDPLIAEDIAVCLIRRDISVSASVYTSDDVRPMLDSRNPDLVLLDINLDGKQAGIEVARMINNEYKLPFIFLTAYSDKMTLQEARDAEPAGYIVKPFTEAGLYAAIEIAYHNHTQKIKHNYPDLFLPKINLHIQDPLSEREFDVMKLLYEGFSNQQMANKLFVSHNTIKAHIKNSYFKLDTNSRSATIARLRELMLM